MKIDLTKLLTNNVDTIEFNENVEISSDYFNNVDIRNIKDLNVSGEFYKDENDNVLVEMNIKCTLVLICSVSLNDVDYNIDININENITENDENLQENVKIINNSIDLMPIIWQNIILEVPLKVVDPKIEVKNINGDGWRLVTDEEDIKSDNSQIKEKLRKFLDE